LTRLARGTPTSLFREFVEVGEGRVLGRHGLEFWGPRAEEREAIHCVLQVPDHIASSRLRQLEARFLDWYDWTVDLPGTQCGRGGQRRDLVESTCELRCESLCGARQIR
jgi:hypothetical protein